MAASRSARRSSKKQYVWDKNARKPAGLAQPFGEAIESVTRRGKWIACDVVKVLKSVNHPCHDLLDWDDKHAGQKWREEQVRSLSRRLNFVIKQNGDSKPIPVAVSLVRGDGYMSTDYVLQREDLKNKLLEMALREAREWMARYKHLEELAEVFAVIDKIAAS